MKNDDFIRTTMAENGFASEVKIGKDGISAQVVKLKPSSEIKFGDYPLDDAGGAFVSTGTIDADRICSEIGQELVQGKATVIADRVTIRNGTVLYFDESLLDSGEAPPSDSFFPPSCPAPQNPRDCSEEA